MAIVRGTDSPSHCDRRMMNASSLRSLRQSLGIAGMINRSMHHAMRHETLGINLIEARRHR